MSDIDPSTPGLPRKSAYRIRMTAISAIIAAMAAMGGIYGIGGLMRNAHAQKHSNASSAVDIQYGHPVKD